MQEHQIIFSKNLGHLQAEMYRFALKLTADAEQANDLLQDTSLRALENAEKYATDTNFKAWMYTVMRNVFINNCRKSLSARHHTLHIGENDWEGRIDSFEYPDSHFDRKELIRTVNRLKSGERVPFYLYVSGYKYGEIAERLELPLGTIKSRIHFARRKLQGALKEYAPNP